MGATLSMARNLTPIDRPMLGHETVQCRSALSWDPYRAMGCRAKYQ